jgi:SAM-dependent methyltransferase
MTDVHQFFRSLPSSGPRPLRREACGAKAFYDGRAEVRAQELNRFYHQLLAGYFRFLVPPRSTVLELGCGLGDLLAAVQPGHGVGVDFSPRMIERARQRHPELEFHVADALEFTSKDRFNYILLADLVNDVTDVQALLTAVLRCACPGTRLVLNFFSNLWRPILAAAEWMRAKAPAPAQNWLSEADMRNLLHLTGWEVVKTQNRILLPVKLGVVSAWVNRWVAPLPILRHLCLSTFLIARPRPQANAERQYTCSVIIPARNEAGNIDMLLERVPDMGKGTEVVFVEGHSRDETWEKLQSVKAAHPDRQIRILKQSARGKGAAVREGFAAASGDLLFILDADLTVPPEELPKFYEAIRSGTAEFVNGVRLVYPLGKDSMRFMNMLANHAFSLAFSWLLGRPIKDTLCGTKVLFRSEYEAIARNRRSFGDFDPFGDFDLLFGAAKLNLAIVDLPIRYRARTYGQTNIQRWRDGWRLLRMVVFAARRLKFV